MSTFASSSRNQPNHTGSKPALCNPGMDFQSRFRNFHSELPLEIPLPSWWDDEIGNCFTCINLNIVLTRTRAHRWVLCIRVISFLVPYSGQMQMQKLPKKKIAASQFVLSLSRLFVAPLRCDCYADEGYRLSAGLTRGSGMLGSG